MNTTLKTLTAALFAITGFVATVQPAAAINGYLLRQPSYGGCGPTMLCAYPTRPTYPSYNYPSREPNYGTVRPPSYPWGGSYGIPTYRVYAR
jgi:hypothetical protein